MSSKYTFRISNYRCFPRETPVEFSIGDGITAFVGRNNAGKSALLRFLHEIRPLIPALNHTPHSEGQYFGVTFQPPVRDAQELFSNRNNGDSHFDFELPVPASSPMGKASQRLEVRLRRSDANFTITKLNGHDARPFQNVKPENGVFYSTPPRKPLADGGALSASLGALAQSMYLPAFRTMSGGGLQSYDMMVGSAFVSTWVNARDGNTLNQRQALRRVEEDVRRLMGFRRFETRKASTADSLLVTIDDADYHLDEVGAGVAQLLMLLGTVALKRPAFLFIDEPELNLHPSLQIDLVATLAGYVKGNLAFATHNIGLARATANRIYAVNQVEAGHSTVHILEDTPTLAQLLGELQYGAYAQVGGNRVLLVEGPDDVLVFQQFLRKLGMDHQVIVLPLGGGGMINGDRAIQLEEVKRICPNVAAIVDSERIAPAVQLSRPRQAFMDTCAGLKFKCHATERRATEHYFPQRALQAAFGPEARELAPFAEIKLEGGWSKGTNWLAAAEMTKDELLATDVGVFLSSWCATAAGNNV
jgi:predicted ATPase